MNELRARQVQRYELGQVEPDGEILFERQTFKEALPEVSRVRLTQTLYAEYPAIKERLEALREAKTRHTVESLAAAWKVSMPEAQKMAHELAEIGFFERRGERDAPEYWVPFLYRDALDMVQGTAE
jgi:Fic family protein